MIESESIVVGGSVLPKNITMQDIANKLGVSKVTVSKALGDKDGVGEELKSKIKALAESMGYRYNTLASAMKSGLSYNVGVIIAERFVGSEQDNPFYLSFFRHLTKALDKLRYSSLLHVLTESDEDDLILPRSYFDRKIDACIVLGQVSNSYINLLSKSEIPFIFLDFYDEHSDVDTINSDNFYGAYTITNYLIKNNHKEIAFYGSIKSTSSIQDRYLGYYKSLLEHNIELKKGFVIEDRDDHGKTLPITLPEKLPTAFVCNCDLVAYNLIEELHEKGFKVPQDVSVVGFDNDIYSTISRPQITTVDVNMEEMTETAANVIVEKISNPEKKFGRMLVRGKIVFRDSVSKL